MHSAFFASAYQIGITPEKVFVEVMHEGAPHITRKTPA
jgi:hypothetical protein